MELVVNVIGRGGGGGRETWLCKLKLFFHCLLLLSLDLNFFVQQKFECEEGLACCHVFVVLL